MGEAAIDLRKVDIGDKTDRAMLSDWLKDRGRDSEAGMLDQGRVVMPMIPPRRPDEWYLMPLNLEVCFVVESIDLATAYYDEAEQDPCIYVVGDLLDVGGRFVLATDDGLLDPIPPDVVIWREDNFEAMGNVLRAARVAGLSIIPNPLPKNMGK